MGLKPLGLRQYLIRSAHRNGNRYEIASQIFVIASIHYRQF